MRALVRIVQEKASSATTLQLGLRNLRQEGACFAQFRFKHAFSYVVNIHSACAKYSFTVSLVLLRRSKMMPFALSTCRLRRNRLSSKPAITSSSSHMHAINFRRQKKEEVWSMSTITGQALSEGHADDD